MKRSSRKWMYKLQYHPRCIKSLKRLPKNTRTQLLSKLEKLADFPEVGSLDVKSLVGPSQALRLRHRDVRVIFEVDTDRKTIWILEIGFRGSIYQK